MAEVGVGAGIGVVGMARLVHWLFILLAFSLEAAVQVFGEVALYAILASQVVAVAASLGAATGISSTMLVFAPQVEPCFRLLISLF